jgi:hypothetical protein
MPEPTMNPRLDALLSRVADEAATAQEWRELEALLAAAPAARRRYVQMMDLHAELRARHVKASSPEAAQGLPKSPGSFAWVSWRPLMAAAAGIVLGMFCTSVLFGYTMPRVVATASRLFALVDGSFEKTGGPVASGFPSEFGKWSGDEAEVVSGNAMDGKQALRFVRAEGDAAVPNSPANSCDVYQLVDLRPLKADAEGGEATLEMSAQFLDARSAKGADVTFTCRLYVFSGSPESLRGEWPLTRKEALAAGSGAVQSTGGAPQTWRSVTAKVLLPAQADFAVVQLVAGKAPASDNQAAEFGEQFADDVRLTLKTQPTLPVRIAQR